MSDRNVNTMIALLFTSLIILLVHPQVKAQPPEFERPDETQSDQKTSGTDVEIEEEYLAEENADDDDSIELVQVIGTRKAAYTEITEDTQKLVEMPGSLGDPLGAISALPGVVTPVGGGEPAVRGSSPEDNRYFIDSMPAGYIFHQFNTSIFDENVVQDFQLFTAGFGAQYADATGAIFDIRLRDPKNQQLHTTLTASFLRAGLFIESGVTENSAFYLSARSGLVHLFMPEEEVADDDGIRITTAPKDNDYQLKYHWNINSSNALTLSLAGAQDYAAAEFTELSTFVQENPDFAGDAMIDERFDSQGLSWLHSASSGGELKVSVAKYVDKSRVEWGHSYFNEATLDNTIIKGHFSQPIGLSHRLTLGMESNEYAYQYGIRAVMFVCTDFDVDCQQGRGEVIHDNRLVTLRDSTLYVIDSWDVSDMLNVETGVQWNSNDYTDESFINPRIALSWQAWEPVAITASAGRYNRLPNTESMLPIVGNPNIASPRAEHFTLGLKGGLAQNWTWSAEAYHKNLSQLPLALNGAENATDTNYSNDVSGKAQGVDILINRNLANRWYGWASLSYSVSERTNQRTDTTQAYTLDTPLVVNVVANYKFRERWDAGFRFTLKSGEATTEIIDVKENENFPGYYVPVYGNPYADRLPTYARLDVRVKRDIMMFGLDGSFFIDVLNALNRENIAGRSLDYEKVNESGELHIEQEADMGVFASVGLSVSF